MLNNIFLHVITTYDPYTGGIGGGRGLENPANRKTSSISVVASALVLDEFWPLPSRNFKCNTGIDNLEKK